MPDVNKLSAMAEAGYEVAECCATCHHKARIVVDGNWSICTRDAAVYPHGKHHKERSLPAHTVFRCDYYERAKDLRKLLGSYATEPWKEYVR